MKGFILIPSLLIVMGVASVQAGPVMRYHYNAINQLVQADTDTSIYH